MAEISTVRLVRCPKCENLLPEFPDFSVYQCGGCGAVLRGKKSNPVGEGLLEKSNGETGRKSFEKEEVSVESASEFQRENDGVVDVKKMKDSDLGEKLATPDLEGKTRSSSRMENVESLVGVDDQIRRGRLDQGRIGVYDDNYGRASRGVNDNGVQVNGCGLNMNVPVYSGLGASNESQEVRQLFRSERSRSYMERNEPASFIRNSSVVAKGRFGNSPYPYEGPSNYLFGSVDNFGRHIRNPDDLDTLARTDDLENDRLELLSKLDELKDQLSRSRGIAEQPKGRLDHYGLHNVKAPSTDFNPYHQTVPYGTNPTLGMRGFYPPSRYVPNEILRYEDAYHPQILRRSSHQLPNHDMPPSYLDRHAHDAIFHQPSCSCLQCYNKSFQSHHNIPPQVFRSLNPNYTIPNLVNPVTYGPQPIYTSRSLEAHQPHSLDISLMRSSSDIHSDNGGFSQRHTRRVIVTRGGERVSHPIAGGAPFITCGMCFELLKVPRKLMVVEGKNQRKMKCGGCAATILFKVEEKSFVVSVPGPINQVRSRVGNNSAGTSSKSLHSSRDYDNSGYDFHLTEVEPNLQSSDQRSSSSEAEKMQEPRFSSSSFSEDEESPDSVILRRNVSDHAGLPSNDMSSSQHPDSPLEENTTSINVVSPYGEGNRSKKNDHEKVTAGRSMLHNSLKDASTVTEMNISLNDYISSGVSSEEVSKVEDQHRNNKMSDSFLAGFIKRRFKDFSRSSSSTEKGRSTVFVNGQLLPDRVVKKAEKLAGPIQPGDYWYDYLAGFWGVMNHPCLGVIPPFIEEFNYPMPENCAAGNTGVFVNGRELNQRDLDLLAGRGLPTTRGKSYIIEISGKVVDEDTNEESESLGKLAPTVERVKHGFGMKVPGTSITQ